MSFINVTDLTFAYESSYDYIFEHASFQMDTDWKLGLVGRNGRGKTTLLNLLLGKYEYEGTITASTMFEYFPYEVKDKSKITLDILEEMDSDFESWNIVKELNLLKVEEDVLYRPYDTLSNGEQTKVLLASLFTRDNHFLMIDEPTNHLDTATKNLVAEYLKAKKGFLLVSHDRRFLDQVVDHMLAINKANIEVQKGNFTSWWENKERQDHLELEQNQRLEGEIKRLEEAARRTASWSDKVEKTKFGGKQSSGLRPDRGAIGHKAAKMMKRTKVTQSHQEAAIEEKSKLLKNIEHGDQLRVIPLKYHKERLVAVSDFSISYEERAICSHINFEIHTGDRICLEGPNGCGKSSIIKAILRQPIPYEGTLHVSANLKSSYVSQDTSHLHGSFSDYAREYGIDETRFLALLRKLDFERVQFQKKLEHLSDGQKKKILIARSLCEQAHLYIWDEPLNFIDILSRIQIEKLILEYQPTILFVEHDSIFQEKVATRIVTVF